MEPTHEPVDLVPAQTVPDLAPEELVEPEPAPTYEPAPVTELLDEPVEDTPDVEADPFAPIEPLSVAAEHVAAREAIEATKASPAGVPETRSHRARARRDRARHQKSVAAAVATDEDAGQDDNLVATLPAVPGSLAVLVSGALVGLATVGLAIGALRGCEAVRGTGNCGDSLGLLALVAILAGAILLGGVLLRVLKVPDPFSTSFLGVGLVATISMLFLLEALDSPAMLWAIPALTAGAFLLSWWVTVRFVNTADEDYDED